VSPRTPNRRIRLLLLAFVLLFGITLGRAAWLQVVKGADYQQLAVRQHHETIPIPAGRGTIYDRTGEPLAIGEQTTTVFADPKAIQNPKRAAVAAGKAFGLEPNFLYRDLTNRKLGFVYVARKADPIVAARLESQNIAGLGFYSEEKRVYPQGGVAAQVVGYAGTDNHGLEGLEHSLDSKLAGKAGSETIVKDPFGRVVDVVKSRPESRGQNVKLTIDHQIQANAESILAETVRKWHAKGGSAIVLDPRTGQILAMANAPGFDSNRFGAVSPDLHRNRAVTDVYEPGSTFKLVTISGALEDGIVTPQTPFTLAPTIEVADRTIHDAETRGTERMTVQQILAHSSNVGTVTIAEKLGPGELARWVHRWGFGSQTGVDFPGESSGLVLPLQQWSGSTIGTVPIGLGIAVTPMQMASAYATIANKGVRMTPHLVLKVGAHRVKAPEGHRIVSRATARKVMAMLRDVVVQGTGTEAAIPGYTVAGKTGTANKPTSRGYSTTKYVASFVGVVPARNPRLVVMVMIDEPKGTIWGGVVAAPAFARIAQFDLQYLEVAPDAPRTRLLAGAR
jgi:cell division protein FtsI (penicillin-binding protein 3)